MTGNLPRVGPVYVKYCMYIYIYIPYDVFQTGVTYGARRRGDDRYGPTLGCFSRTAVDAKGCRLEIGKDLLLYCSAEGIKYLSTSISHRMVISNFV